MEPGEHVALQRMSDPTLQRMRMLWKGKRYVFIDEISMVGCEKLHAIDQRLRDIMQVESPFGDLSIICFGDLYQLPPVAEHRVFSGLQGELWKMRFVCIELNENYRAKLYPTWAASLARIRVGRAQLYDKKQLDGLVVDANGFRPAYPTDPFPDDVPCFFPQCKQAEAMSHTNVHKPVSTCVPH